MDSAGAIITGNSTGSLALCVLPHQMSQAPSVLPPDTISLRESISGDLRPWASPRSSQEAPFPSCQPPVRTAEWQCGEAWLLGLEFGLSLGSDLSLLVLFSLHAHQLGLFPRGSIYWWWLVLDQVGSRTWVRQWLGPLLPTVRFRGFSYLCADLEVSGFLWSVVSVSHKASSSASCTHHLPRTWWMSLWSSCHPYVTSVPANSLAHLVYREAQLMALNMRGMRGLSCGERGWKIYHRFGDTHSLLCSDLRALELAMSTLNLTPVKS